DTVNSVLVTSPEGIITTPRGFSISRLLLTTVQGTITAVMALNDAALNPIAPYYPRTVQGYIASNEMSGTLAGKVLVLPVAGTVTGGLGGAFAAPLNALIEPSGGANAGWQVGDFAFVDTGGDILDGIWVADLAGSDPNYAVVGHVFEIAGTGIYSDSMLYGNL